MGASIAVIASSFILVASAFICLCCYRRYKAKLAVRDGGGGGGSDGNTVEQGAGAVNDGSRHRNSTATLDGLFRTWWRLKRAKVQQQNRMEQQQQQQQQQQHLQLHLRSSQQNGSSIAASISNFEPGVRAAWVPQGARGQNRMGGGSDGGVLSRRATEAVLHDAGFQLYLQQQQQQQHQQHPLVQDHPDRFGRKSRG
ncbi:hypothetical protein Vafri_7801 [Volvox africanus]|uniref:Uncharacterized protein n=1 Tax=Volvox africanus TaxID=51714 RepID=A0A8J4F0W7_9CHLO|nr:hypothetical protein Vafri_7801 [Volvox africanus]